jgi:hypothetical protein
VKTISVSIIIRIIPKRPTKHIISLKEELELKQKLSMKKGK